MVKVVGGVGPVPETSPVVFPSPVIVVKVIVALVPVAITVTLEPGCVLLAGMYKYLKESVSGAALKFPSIITSTEPVWPADSAAMLKASVPVSLLLVPVEIRPRNPENETKPAGIEFTVSTVKVRLSVPIFSSSQTRFTGTLLLTVSQTA